MWNYTKEMSYEYMFYTWYFLGLSIIRFSKLCYHFQFSRIQGCWNYWEKSWLTLFLKIITNMRKNGHYRLHGVLRIKTLYLAIIPPFLKEKPEEYWSPSSISSSYTFIHILLTKSYKISGIRCPRVNVLDYFLLLKNGCWQWLTSKSFRIHRTYREYSCISGKFDDRLNKW